MLWNYVSDHPQNGDKFADPLTHACNLHVHRAAWNRPLDLILSRPRPEFTLHDDTNGLHRSTLPSSVISYDCSNFSQRFETAIGASRNTLANTSARYDIDFDKGLCVARERPTVGEWVSRT